MSRLLAAAFALLGSACVEAMPAPDAPRSSALGPIVLAPTGAGSPASASLSVTVDAAGVDYLLHLDGRALGRMHLMIGTPNEPTDKPSFTLRLSQTDGTLIRDGWDVPISGPQSFENLEWSPPTRETDVVLHVASKSGTRSTTVSVAFFDPLE